MNCRAIERLVAACLCFACVTCLAEDVVFDEPTYQDDPPALPVREVKFTELRWEVKTEADGLIGIEHFSLRDQLWLQDMYGAALAYRSCIVSAVGRLLAISEPAEKCAAEGRSYSAFLPADHSDEILRKTRISLGSKESAR